MLVPEYVPLEAELLLRHFPRGKNELTLLVAAHGLALQEVVLLHHDARQR